MDKAKKIIKIVAIIIAVAAAVVGVAFAVKKIIDKKKAVADEPENTSPAPAAIPAHPQPTDFRKNSPATRIVVWQVIFLIFP